LSGLVPPAMGVQRARLDKGVLVTVDGTAIRRMDSVRDVLCGAPTVV
jgi:hypothetical protein